MRSGPVPAARCEPRSSVHDRHARLGPNDAADLDARQLGEHQVEQDEVRAHGTELGEPCTSNSLIVGSLVVLGAGRRLASLGIYHVAAFKGHPLYPLPFITAAAIAVVTNRIFDRAEMGVRVGLVMG